MLKDIWSRYKHEIGPIAALVAIMGAIIGTSGTYYKNGKLCFTVRDIIVDSHVKVIQFSVFTNDRVLVHKEYLAAVDKSSALDRQDRFVGSCSHAHWIEYRRSSR